MKKDHLYHVLNRIKRKQREHGSNSAAAMWRYAKALNNDIAKKVAAAITEFAVLYSVDVIVFEHLSFTGKKHGGSKAQKLSMWKRNSIQDYVEHKAHRCGIRISRICAWGQANLPLMAAALSSVMKPIVPLQRLQAANNTTAT